MNTLNIKHWCQACNRKSCLFLLVTRCYQVQGTPLKRIYPPLNQQKDQLDHLRTSSRKAGYPVPRETRRQVAEVTTPNVAEGDTHVEVQRHWHYDRGFILVLFRLGVAKGLY